MVAMRMIANIFVTASVVAVASCSGGDAYVDRPYEINRDSSDYPDGPKRVAGSELTVCYSRSASTPQEIYKLADDECRRFGLTAVLSEQVYTLCPIITPMAALYTCEAAVAGRSNASGQPAAATDSGLFNPPVRNQVQGKGSVLPDNFGSPSVSTTAKSEPFPTFLFNDPSRPQQ